MERHEVKQLYTDKAAFYHNLFVVWFLYGRGLKAALRRAGCLRSGMKVLDAGCGTGILTRNLYEIARENELRDITYHGLDLTPAMMNLFKEWISRNIATGITIQEADVLKTEQLPPGWADYDLIVSSGMLEHLPKEKLGKALVNLRGLMKEDATLIIFITRRNFIMKYLIHLWWKANMYERDEVARVFHEAGLSTQFRKFPFPYNHLNLWGFVIEAKRNDG